MKDKHAVVNNECMLGCHQGCVEWEKNRSPADLQLSREKGKRRRSVHVHARRSVLPEVVHELLQPLPVALRRDQQTS